MEKNENTTKIISFKIDNLRLSRHSIHLAIEFGVE